MSQILQWDQITTYLIGATWWWSCFQCFKDTKMRANHNLRDVLPFDRLVVSNVSKILKWEQITTVLVDVPAWNGCFQCFKDTKMRANHNLITSWNSSSAVVSNVSKILKWEQITTDCRPLFCLLSLFPMFQRY